MTTVAQPKAYMPPEKRTNPCAALSALPLSAAKGALRWVARTIQQAMPEEHAEEPGGCVNCAKHKAMEHFQQQQQQVLQQQPSAPQQQLPVAKALGCAALRMLNEGERGLLEKILVDCRARGSLPEQHSNREIFWLNLFLNGKHRVEHSYQDAVGLASCFRLRAYM